MVLCTLCIILTSCGPGGNSFRIRGRFRDMQAGELYIYNLSSDNARFDTLTVQEGKFQYKGQAEEVVPYFLVFPNGVEQVIFVGPGSDLKYEASANDLKNYVVDGSEENELMNRFREETYQLNPSAMTGTARSYIKDNPASPVALYLLATYFVNNEEVSDEELSDLLKVMKAKHPHDHILLDVDSKLASAKKRKVGQTLPDITLMKPDRTTVKLWSSQKDYTLLVFWASWTNASAGVLWDIRRYYEKHPVADRLRTVAVSLDIDRPHWEDCIRQDSASAIQHYCDGRSLESKAVKALGISTVPYYILTDRNHKVLETADDMKKMEEKLTQLLE